MQCIVCNKPETNEPLNKVSRGYPTLISQLRSLGEVIVLEHCERLWATDGVYIHNSCRTALRDRCRAESKAGLKEMSSNNFQNYLSNTHAVHSSS